ncbi:MAG: radical SAM protein [Nitrospirae bacterium]|nr:radical SAM protein [Nitrospirota bacterium]
MNILLIRPYLTRTVPDKSFPVEPLGLLYLATYARRMAQETGIELNIEILDAQLSDRSDWLKTDRGYRQGLDDNEIKSYLSRYNADIVGITNSYTAHLQDVLELVAMVKTCNPAALIVIGGAHATIDHVALASRKDIDMVVRGEGEEIFADVLLAKSKGMAFGNIAGITLMDNGTLKINEDRPLITDLDTLPIPDRSYIKYESYLQNNSTVVPKHKPVGTIFSSRGCPYNCIFCSTSKVWRNIWRGRSPENVMREIDYLTTTYGVQEICFEDDQFMGNRKRVIDLCNLIAENKMVKSVIVPPGISPRFIDDEILDAFKRAKFYRLMLSVDVGVESSRKYVRKPVDLNKIRDIVKKCNKKGFWTYASFVVGFPEETEQDVINTINFAYSLHLDTVVLYLAQPHLGSELFEIYKREGLIKEDVDSSFTSDQDMFKTFFGTYHVSSKELTALVLSASNGYQKYHLRHFLNPSYVAKEFVPKIFSLDKVKYFAKLLRWVLNDK